MEKRKTVKIKDATNSNVEKLYSSFGGRVVLKVLIRPKLSKFVGFILDKRISKVFISSFIKNNNIDINLFEDKKYKSFNEFFIRKIKLENRPYSKNKKDFILDVIALCRNYILVNFIRLCNLDCKYYLRTKKRRK